MVAFLRRTRRTLGERSAPERECVPDRNPRVNDFAAIGALGATRAADLQVGVDIAVVGFNDTPLADELPIPLTSVRSPMHEMDVQAMTSCSTASMEARSSRSG